jgi:hypothetical protein
VRALIRISRAYGKPSIDLAAQDKNNRRVAGAAADVALRDLEINALYSFRLQPDRNRWVNRASESRREAMAEFKSKQKR